MKPPYNNYELEWLEVRYNGQQESPRGIALDMFTDQLTGSTFLRMPLESIVEARDRNRKGFEGVL
jgi:hypothetical protein